MSWLVMVSKLCVKTLNIIRFFKIIFLYVYKLLNLNCLPRDVKLLKILHCDIYIVYKQAVNMWTQMY
jgi:hypothetical protein